MRCYKSIHYTLEALDVETMQCHMTGGDSLLLTACETPLLNSNPTPEFSTGAYHPPDIQTWSSRIYRESFIRYPPPSQVYVMAHSMEVHTYAFLLTYHGNAHAL